MTRFMVVALALVVACKPSTDRSDTGDIDDPVTVDAGADDVDAPASTDATPGDGGVPPGPDADATVCGQAVQHSDFAWIQANVLTPSCAVAGCHTGPNAEVGLRLDAGEAYNNLVNKGSSTVSGWVRVVPGSPTTSYLVVSFGRAEGPPPRDGFMPLGADPLCTPIHEAVERWITAGAQP